MRKLRFYFVGAGLIIFDFVLAGSGVLHFRDGLALEAAFPVPLAISLNRALPTSDYVEAADALRGVSLYDGDAQIIAADARFYVNERPQNLISAMETGLSSTPASTVGWISYSAMLEESDPKRAAMALDQAFSLAPYDYYWAGARTLIAAYLWNNLSRDTRNAAMRQVRILWENASLRDQVLLLLASANGGLLLERTYANEPDTIRAINRWVSARHRYTQTRN